MIYFRTFAYNAEKTLRKSVDSVLNQTHKEFVYYLMDNGSTDGTRAIRSYTTISARPGWTRGRRPSKSPS